MKTTTRIMRTGVLLASLAAGAGAHATHLIGGNLGYTYLGETFPGSGMYTYQVNMEFYLNCGPDSNWPDFFTLLGEDYGTPLMVGVYTHDPMNPDADKVQIGQVPVYLTDTAVIEPDLPNNCVVGQGLCTERGMFSGTIDLPLNFGGYHFYFQLCCRNNNIDNLLNPGFSGIGYYAFAPPPLVNNSSPTWLGIPVPFLCTQDTTTFLNAATDPDGDQLVFSFQTPYDSYTAGGGLIPPPAILTWPIPEVAFDAGFSVTQPFGAGGYSYINGSTGLTEYLAPIQGNYVVAVEVREYRFGQLIGRTRRDLQLQVIACPPNNTPSVNGTLGTYWEVQAGDQLCFNMNFNDVDGDSLFLTAAGAIFDTTLFDPAATIGAPDSALAFIGSTFCWDTECDQGQDQPYVFSVSVTDNGCPPKTIDVVFQVEVIPFAGPQLINGPDQACTGQSGAVYSTDPITGAVYTWDITGGTIASGQGTSSVTVDWGPPGIGSISVFATDTLSCPSQPISLSVNIAALPITDAGPDTAVCLGSFVTLGGGPTGPPGSSYLWTPSIFIPDSTVANPQAFPDTSTTFIVQVSNSGCTNTDTVFILVDVPHAEASPAQAICLGDTAQLQASPGLGYLWMPNNTLSDSAIADPLAFPTTTTMYAVFILDSLGCEAKDSVLVTVNALPVANAGTDTTICPNTDVVIGGSPTGPPGSEFIWTIGALLVDSVANPQVSPTSTTTYTVQVNDSNACSMSDQVTVTVLPAPAVDAGPDQSVCLGDTAQLQGSGAGELAWSPAATLSNDTIGDPLAHPTSTTTYTLTVTDGSACENTDQATVFVLDLPAANAGDDVSICLGDTVQLNATGGATYLWTPPTGLSDPGIADPLAYPSATTTYALNVTDTSSCSAGDSITVVVNAPPDAGVDGGTTVCSSDGPVDLFALLGGSPDMGGSWSPGPVYDPGTGGGTFTYVVQELIPCPADSSVVTIAENEAADAGSDGAADLCTSDSLVVLFDLLGAADGGGIWFDPFGTPFGGILDPSTDSSGTYLYVVAGLAPCADDSSLVQVSITGAMSAGSNDSVLICGSGTPFTMTDSLGGAPDLSGTWTDPNGDPHGGLFDPAVDIDGTYTFTVAAGTVCEAAATLEVVVQNPLVDAGSDQAICIGDTAQLDGQGTGSLAWSPVASLNDPSIADPIAYPDTTTTYTLSLVDALGCVNSDQMTLTVNALPQADAGADQSICDGQSTPLGGSPTGPPGSTFSWTNGGSLNNATAANPVADPTVTTTYIVTVNDANSCTDTDSVTVTVNPLPVVNAGNDTSFCLGGSVQLSASGAGGFSWSPTTGLSDPGIADPIASPSVTTTYTVTLTDTNSCSASDAITVTVNSLPTANAGPDVWVCPGFDVQLTGSGGGTYSWSPAAELDDPSIATPMASPPATTIFTLVVTDANGCQGIDATTVTVNDDPQVDAGPDQNICLGQSVQLGGSPTSVIPGVAYLWMPNTSLDDNTSANPNASPVETITYVVTVTSDTCTNSDQMTVTVEGIAQAAFTARLEPTCDGLRAFFIDLSSGAVEYWWDFDQDGTQDSDEITPQHFFPYGQPIVVTLTVTDIYGCTNTATETWAAGEFDDLVEINVPNVFTPNGDGKNDVFTLGQHPDDVPSYSIGPCTEMFIFNRWGQKVFESMGNDITWYGRTFAGEECVTGTYFYVIRVKDMEFNGDVYLNR